MLVKRDDTHYVKIRHKNLLGVSHRRSLLLHTSFEYQASYMYIQNVAVKG